MRWKTLSSSTHAAPRANRISKRGPFHNPISSPPGSNKLSCLSEVIDVSGMLLHLSTEHMEMLAPSWAKPYRPSFNLTLAIYTSSMRHAEEPWADHIYFSSTPIIPSL